jgi:hypothetical protein
MLHDINEDERQLRVRQEKNLPSHGGKWSKLIDTEVYRDGAIVNKRLEMEQEQVADLDQSQGIGGVNSSPVQEKRFTEADVNSIVEARIAREKAKHAASLEQAKSQSMGGMAQLSPEQVQRMIEEATHRKIAETERKRHEDYMAHQFAQEGERLADKFKANIAAGKGEYEDFDKVFDVNDFAQMMHVVGLAADMDNTADIMYELSKNPGKALIINDLASKSPRGAQIEMQKLSDSIKKNKEAQNARTATEPLSQIKPSTAGSDNGSMTTSDFRKMFPG